MVGAERSLPHRPFSIGSLQVLALSIVEAVHGSDPDIIPIVGIVAFRLQELNHLQFGWSRFRLIPVAVLPSISSMSPCSVDDLHWIVDMLSSPSPSGGGFPTPTLRSGYR